MRLGAEGLVELEQNRGFKVSEVTPKKLADLMRTRIEIENIALRWSLEKGSLEWEANLVSSFHRLSRQTKHSNSKPGTISPAGAKSTPISTPLWWRHAILNRFFRSGCVCSNKPNGTSLFRLYRTARGATTYRA